MHHQTISSCCFCYCRKLIFMKSKIVFIVFFSLFISMMIFSPKISASNPSSGNPDSCKNISKKELLNANCIEDILGNYPKNEFEIIHYNFLIYGRGVVYSEIDTSGNQLSFQLRQKIKSMPFGAKLLLEKIKVRAKTDNSIKENYIRRCFVLTAD